MGGFVSRATSTLAKLNANTRCAGCKSLRKTTETRGSILVIAMHKWHVWQTLFSFTALPSGAAPESGCIASMGQSAGIAAADACAADI